MAIGKQLDVLLYYDSTGALMHSGVACFGLTEIVMAAFNGKFNRV